MLIPRGRKQAKLVQGLHAKFAIIELHMYTSFIHFLEIFFLICRYLVVMTNLKFLRYLNPSDSSLIKKNYAKFSRFFTNLWTFETSIIKIFSHYRFDRSNVYFPVNLDWTQTFHFNDMTYLLSCLEWHRATTNDLQRTRFSDTFFITFQLTFSSLLFHSSSPNGPRSFRFSPFLVLIGWCRLEIYGGCGQPSQTFSC